MSDPARERLQGVLRLERRALQARFGAHALGIGRGSDARRGATLRVYVTPGAPPLPDTVTLTDEAGAFEVEVVRVESPPAELE